MTSTTLSQPASVLIYDRDEAAGNLLARRLVREGYRTEMAGRFADFLERVERIHPDLLVVGLDVRGASRQLEVLARQDAPPLVVLLWAEGELEVADALDAGADDALERPFSPRLFVARVRALLRRSPGSGQSTRAPDQMLDFAGLCIDTQSRQVLVDGVNAPLTAREFDLLAYLARNPRQVFTRHDLLAHVWGANEGWISSATVTEHVRRIRQHIERDPSRPEWIVTVRSVGYRFEPGVTA